MTTLHDRMMAKGLYAMPWAGDAKVDPSALESVVIVRVDNVAKYYLEVSDKDYWALDEDFPNLAPPLDVAWFEWRESGTVRINRGGRVEVVDVGLAGAIAVLVESRRRADGTWVLLASTFFEWHGRVLGPQAMMTLVVTPNGQVSDETFQLAKEVPAWCRAEHGRKAWPVALPGGEELVRRSGKKAAMELVTATVDTFKVVALAMSFMHCKNVDRRTVVPSPIERMPWKKKYGRPLARYEVLDIDPMKKTLESEGGASENGLKKALHICRGHFATYTEDAPLFGKITGTFWRSQHLRGSAKSGVVVKDYNVNAPSPE